MLTEEEIIDATTTSLLLKNAKRYKLGELFKIKSGGTPNRQVNEYFEKGLTPWVKTGDLKVKNLFTSEEFITDAGLRNSSAKLFPKNTVLIAMYGATIGACSILKIDAATNQACAALLPNENIDVDYLYYYLLSIKSQLVERGVGGGQPNISATILKDVEIPLPDLAIQKEIAQILGEADIARQKRKAANALTDQFLQSTFLSMFGDPIENSHCWNKQQIWTFVNSIISGKSVQSEQRKKHRGEFGVLKVSAVTYGYFKPEEHKAIVNGFLPEEGIKPKKGDVLFSRANTKELVAATCIVDKDYDDLFLPDKLWKINLEVKKVHPVFFKYVLSHPSFRNKLSEKATGTSGSMFNISKEKLCEFDFPIPPIELQQKFASIVADTEQLRQKQKQSEMELENLFQSLLQKYFS